VPSALLAKQMKFREMALAQSLASVIQGVATLIMAHARRGHIGPDMGDTARNLRARRGAKWMYLRDRPKPNLNMKALRPLWASGSQRCGAARALFTYRRTSTRFSWAGWVVRFVLGSYSLAKTLSHSMLDQLSGIVNQYRCPPVAAKIDDDNAQVEGFCWSSRRPQPLVFPLFLVDGIFRSGGVSPRVRPSVDEPHRSVHGVHLHSAAAQRPTLCWTPPL